MPPKKTTDKKTIQLNSKTLADRPKDAAKKVSNTKKFPVVGLGASAGGLQALKAFFSNVSENSGMAFIVVVHMAPKQPSMMPELIQKVTHLPVSTAKDGQTIEPGHIYVTPPDKELSIYKGALQLMGSVKKGVPHPIDLFLKSLARDQGVHSAAIILSGTGTDGTLGIKEINANEGVVLVQLEASAGYDGMPRSAISTGLVDAILPPDEMPKKLLEYFEYAKSNFYRKSYVTDSAKQRIWLGKVFAILRTQIGHDFSAYKVNTILRRIDRRMGLNQITNHDIYVRYLRENPGEADSLFRELLIGVTNFFRDAESFEVLKRTIIPQLIEQMQDDDVFRVWVPGCSTGEEAYSLAIVIRELLDKNPKRIKLQIFGTDIDNLAIDKAREGLFPDSIAANVSKERLKRFFIKEGNFFRIRNEIRECVIYSVQDLIKDPPFSHLNLLCCRNLLIYLNTETQKKILPLFHYTLNPAGILVLGTSETIGGFSNLFKILDKKWKIFSRLGVSNALRPQVDFPSGLPRGNGQAIANHPLVAHNSNISQITQRVIIEQFAPTAILVDANGEILHIQGRTGKYLEAPSGPPSQNIKVLARDGLRIELSSALRAANALGEKVIHEKISIRSNGDVQTINLHVCPQQYPKELAGLFLVFFEDIDIKSTTSVPDQETVEAHLREPSRIKVLEKELKLSRESHQTMLEELESSNEELKSTNEELQSSNEELQSTNEELESSKEELQTVNAELQSKIDDLFAIQDDMKNLLNSTEIATIFVDNEMCVKRFTHEATQIVNLIPSDRGRPLQHVVSNLLYDEMITNLAEVLRKLIPMETEVQSTDGIWYKMRIIPYRTTSNRIDGAVLTFSSIDVQKNYQHVLADSKQKFERAWELVRAIFDMDQEPTVVLDDKGSVIIGNIKFSELINIPQKQLKGLDMIHSQSEINIKAGLKSKLKTALAESKDFETGFLALHPSDNRQRYKIQGRIITRNTESYFRILLRFVGEARNARKNS